MQDEHGLFLLLMPVAHARTCQVQHLQFVNMRVLCDNDLCIKCSKICIAAHHEVVFNWTKWLCCFYKIKLLNGHILEGFKN